MSFEEGQTFARMRKEIEAGQGDPAPTSDEKILDWSGSLLRQDARK